MNRNKTVFLAIWVVFGLIGTGYAKWSKKLNIDLNIETYKFEVEAKIDEASTVKNISLNDEKAHIFQVSGFESTVIKIENKGTIPAVIEKIEIEKISNEDVSSYLGIKGNFEGFEDLDVFIFELGEKKLKKEINLLKEPPKIQIEPKKSERKEKLGTINLNENCKLIITTLTDIKVINESIEEIKLEIELKEEYNLKLKKEIEELEKEIQESERLISSMKQKNAEIEKMSKIKESNKKLEQSNITDLSQMKEKMRKKRTLVTRKEKAIESNNKSIEAKKSKIDDKEKLIKDIKNSSFNIKIYFEKYSN